MHRDPRLAPSSLRHALLLLVPLALLATALLGLLAQSATAGHDASPPPTTAVAAPAEVDDDTTPTWTVTPPADTTSTGAPTVVDGATTTVTIAHEYDAQCVLDAAPAPDASFSASTPTCGPSFITGPLSDGTHVLSVRTVETTTRTTTVDDGTGPAPAPGSPTVDIAYSPVTSATYRLDTVDPVVSVTGPTGPSYTGWTVAVIDASSVGLVCTLHSTAGDTVLPGSTCNIGSVKPTLGADGPYSLTVVATDAAGNAAPAVRSADFTYDGTGPSISLPDLATDNETSPQWSFTVTDAVGAPTCSLAGPGVTGPGTCAATGYTAAPLSEAGIYTVTVTAEDGAGNTTTETATYELDLSGPTIVIDPTGPATGTAPSRSWTVTLTGATSSTCAVDGVVLSCAGPLVGTPDGDGPTTLTVSATDAYGNPSTASATYVRDTTAGLTPGTAPATPAADTTPSWSYTVEAGSTVVCALSGPGAAAAGGTCTPTGFTAGVLPETSGADYVLTVTVTDALGNSTPHVLPTYRLDTVAVLTAGAAPASPGSDQRPTWSFTVEAGASVSCALTGPGATGGSCTTTGFTANDLPGTERGDYVLTVTVTDALGTSTVYTLSGYRLDTTAGLTRGAAPATPGRDTTPAWAFTVEPGSSVTCTLTGPGATGGACTTTGFTADPLPSTASADYVLAVTVTDALGNSTTYTLDGYRLDTVGTLAVVRPASPSSDRTPSWTFTPEAGSTVTCTLTGPGAADGTCTNDGFTAAELPGTDGADYVLTVTVADALGNVTVHTQPAYHLDTTADLVEGPAPSSPGRDRTPAWAFTVDAGSTVSCALTGPGATGGTCSTNGFTAYELPTGSGVDYALTVTVSDVLGNETQHVLEGYRLDTVADLTEGAPPSTPGRDTTPTWAFTVEPGSTVSCVLTGPAAAGGSCTTTGFTAAELPTTSGADYGLTVTVTDALGNPTTYVLDGYRLDTVADLTAGTPPPTPANDRTPTWQLTVEPGSTVSCALMGPGAAGGACTTTGFTADELPTTDGADYGLTVTVTDVLGNPTTYVLAGYHLDTTADLVAGATPSTPGNDRTPSWAFTVDAGSTVTCSLVGASATGGTCTTTGFTANELPTTSGADYVLTVTVTDVLGNVTPYVLDGYRLDTTADLTEETPRSTPGNDRTPTWQFTVEPGSTVTCVLAGPGAAGGNCTTTGFTATELPTTSGADYVLTVTVTDALGNPTTYVLGGYRLDTTADLTVVRPATPGNDRTPTWAFTAEPGSTIACALGGPGAAGGTCTTTGFTATELPTTSGADYVLTVTLTDALGNVTVYTQPAHRLDTVADLTPGTPPTAPGNDRAPSWAFTVEPGSTVACALTGPGAAGGTCTTTGFTAGELPTTSGADYVLVVTVTDVLGNPTSYTLPTYRLDTVADLTVVGPATPSSDTTPTWTFTTESGATVTCALAGPGVPSTSSSCTTTGFTPGALPQTSGADYVLTVTVMDALGNETVYTRPAFHLDTRLPVAVVTVPSSPSRQVSVTWVVAVDEPLTSASCQLRRDGVVVQSLANCPGSTTVWLPGDGEYDLVVTLVDLAGNTSTTTSTVLSHDATVPAAPVVSPTSRTTNATTATWTISGEAGIPTTCRLTRDGSLVSDWTACGATYAVALPGDGSYVLEVRSTDRVGSGPSAAVTYLLDTVAPVAPTVTGPTGPAQSRTPSWTVAHETGTTTECRLVRGGAVVNDWAPCSGSSTADLAGLPDGAYVLESRATDLAGNAGAVGSSAAYVLDTTAPLAPVVAGPSGPSQSRNPAFTWAGEAGTTAECQLSRDGSVGGGWVPCTSGYAPSLDRDGTWTLAVRLTDAARNVSETAVTGGYVLDTTPPEAPTVTPPSTPGRDLAPSWGAVVEGGATLECRLTGPDGVSGPWSSCALPHATSLAGRPDGAYVLEVRATDKAGNLSAIGSGTYVLDTVAPAAAVVVSPPGPSRSRTPVFTFTTETRASTRCRLTSGSMLISDFAPCGSPAPVDLNGLPDGTYTLTVRITDAAGNPGPAATGTYVLDTTGPAAPVLLLSPASPSSARSVTWAFGYEPGSTLVCRFTFPTGAVREITGCASLLAVDLTGLPDGSYTLTVRAVDAAGNVGAVLTDVHVIDSSAVAGPEVTGPVSPASTRTPTWKVVSTLPTECRLTRGTTVLRDWTSCAASFTADLQSQPDGTYLLSVRAKTSAGELSASTTSRYVLDTTAPAAATVVAPPTPSTNRMPTWSISSGELGATAECRVLVFGSVLRDWAPCGVSVGGALHAVDLTGLGDGTYTLVVRLTDAAGNRGVQVSSPYVLDTSAPVAVGITGPPTPGNDPTPTWTLSTGSGATLECRLSSAKGTVSDWAPCADTYTANLADLPDGTYTLSVRAVSEAGTAGQESNDAYELIRSLPNEPTALALAGGLKSPSNNRSPSWTFTLPDGASAWCTVVNGTSKLSEGACASGFRFDLSGAMDGTYKLTVQAVDAAGNKSVGVTSTYVLDTEPTAKPTFTQVPGATGSTLDPQWRFTVARGATAQCRLVLSGTTPGDWAPCTTSSSYTASFTGRPDGQYVLQVRAIDSAGNTSEPESSSYLLDRSAAPVPTFTGTPRTPDRLRTVTWSFSAPTGTTLECRLVSPSGTSAWDTCGTVAAGLRTTTAQLVQTGGSYDLDLAGRPDGLYTLEVRVVELDGRRGATASAGYRLDTLPPERPTFMDTPGVGNDARPVWLWDASSEELVECRLVRVEGGPVSAWQECGDSQYVADLSRLGQGLYALELRVTDAAGNVSPSGSATYRYDTTAPDAPSFSTRPPAGGADRTISWTFVVPADAKATCTVTRGAQQVREERACSGRYDLDLSGLPDGVYTLVVRHTDTAGNVSSPTSGTYALRTLGVTGPGRVDPPSQPVPDRPETGGGSIPPSGPGRGGTGAGTDGVLGSAPGADVPTLPGEVAIVRTSGDPAAPAGAADPQEPAGAEPRPEPSKGSVLLPGPIPVEDVPEVLRELVTGTATKPTLPLALLAIVILFLIAQNRIDRRDPKLAAAPVEAEPELDFTTVVRRPGSALS